MNEHTLRFFMFVVALVASFLFALLGLVAGVFIGNIGGAMVGLLFGSGVTIALVGVTVYFAHVFLPKSRTKSRIGVFRAAIAALSAAFTGISAEPSFWHRAINFALPAVARIEGGSSPAERAAELRIPFLAFCASILAVCLLASLAGSTALPSVAPWLAGQQPSVAATAMQRRWRATLEAICFPFATFVLWATFILRAHFGEASSIATAPNSAVIWLAMAAIVTGSVSAAYFLFAAALAASRSNIAIREQYSMPAFAAIVYLVGTLAMCASIATFFGGTPLGSVLAAFRLAAGLPPDWPPSHWAETTLCFLVTVLVCIALVRFHHNWPGQRSVEHYKQDERGEQPSLSSEGWSSWVRMVRTGGLSAAYTREPPQPPQPMEEPPELPWKDRAPELLHLKNSEYVFGSDGWFGQSDCWVGMNEKAHKRVLLFIAYERLDEGVLAEKRKHADQLARVAGPEIAEIFVATNNRSPCPPTRSWKELPVTCYTEDGLLEALIDRREYFQSIQRRVEEERLQDALLTLNQVYVPADAVRTDVEAANPEQARPIEEILDSWVLEPGRRQLALLGEYGQGKSTTTLMWAYRRIQELQPGDRLPLLVELRGTSPSNLTSEGLLAAWAVRFNLNARALLQLIIGGKAVLILEGFDEMSLVGDADIRLQHFRALWQFAFPNSKILFTGRPNFFFDDEERKKSLSIHQSQGMRPYCEAFRLLPFDTHKIEVALRNHPPEVRDQIIEKSVSNPRFHELVARPSLLHAVATLWVQENFAAKDAGALTSADVIGLFLAHSYRRQREKVQGVYRLFLTQDERAYFMSGVAAFMAAKNLPNSISASKLVEATDRLFESIPDSVSTEALAAGEVDKPLRERVGNDILKRGAMLSDVRTCGLLVDDPASAGAFRFAHKSFMEFLVAEVLTEHVLDPESEKASAICHATGAELRTIFALPVALGFLSESLATRLRVDDFLAEGSQKGAYRLACLLFGFFVGERWNPFARARALLYVISSDVRLRDFFARELGTRTFWRSVIRRQLPLLVPVTVMFVAMFSLPRNSAREGIVWSMQGMMWFVAISYWVTRRMNWVNLLVWKALCKQLDISDAVLHQAVRSSLFPWISKSTFRVMSERDVFTMQILVDSIAGEDAKHETNNFTHGREGIHELKRIVLEFCEHELIREPTSGLDGERIQARRADLISAWTAWKNSHLM
ncbi:MAG TPA: hypothetical protein VGP76_12815 [Planctomycetaceae bacterium]|jgi:hypothetical protein|nr:hypothetical protein [Planctomycetaceae bacterium]